MHKFYLGQAVAYHPPRGTYVPTGRWIVTEKLPERNGECYYRIRHASEFTSEWYGRLSSRLLPSTTTRRRARANGRDHRGEIKAARVLLGWSVRDLADAPPSRSPTYRTSKTRRDRQSDISRQFDTP